ncbi:FmdB family zinc ribbon protein [Treponema brennaborense]|uniref:Regulatory protein, FmdB family n=1 Tax=Treponema brennaborense (strain DSM 12168 / CIP 105900 / DD5/3) TaxID=906968 RepID=F4LMM6_TREBD|nr:FmdB family zinc ribbon protein [Treponema brennaborense]AEE16773.1 regulatory protein, FmdB family [Treponema brennaborense DSM 12168]
MPTYEYECESCGKRFEAFQKMSDAALTECPGCGKRVRRVLSAGIGISFQGKGFYVNDSHSGENHNCGGSCPNCSHS